MCKNPVLLKWPEHSCDVLTNGVHVVIISGFYRYKTFRFAAQHKNFCDDGDITATVLRSHCVLSQDTIRTPDLGVYFEHVQNSRGQSASLSSLRPLAFSLRPRGVHGVLTTTTRRPWLLYCFLGRRRRDAVSTRAWWAWCDGSIRSTVSDTYPLFKIFR